MEVFFIIAIVFVCILLWLNFLATLAIKHDHTLEKIQRVAQFIFVWLIPFVGASIVLHFVYEHSPEAISKNWIPWPFKNLIFGKSIKSNKNRDDSEIDYYSGRYRGNSNTIDDD